MKKIVFQQQKFLMSRFFLLGYGVDDMYGNKKTHDEDIQHLGG